MKKQDLKTGMIVQTRRGDIATVFLGTAAGDVFSPTNYKEAEHAGIFWAPLSHYDNDLIHTPDIHIPHIPAADICTIWAGGDTVRSIGSMEKGKVLWERPQIMPQYTPEELFIKLGHKFKIIIK